MNKYFVSRVYKLNPEVLFGSLRHDSFRERQVYTAYKCRTGAHAKAGKNKSIKSSSPVVVFDRTKRRNGIFLSTESYSNKRCRCGFPSPTGLFRVVTGEDVPGTRGDVPKTRGDVPETRGDVSETRGEEIPDESIGYP